MTPPHEFDLQRLLEQREFLRRLARSLVRDTHRADDLVQEVCLVALEQPPARGGSLRPWLGGVLRRLAHKSVAREAEQPAREAEAAHAELDEAAESRDLELSSQVVQAVRELAQPYRGSIWLRYYRGLTPHEIAAELDVPVATVKTRLRRALEQLRNKLDDNFGGERESWCRALVPLAGLLEAPGAGAALGAGTGTALASTSTLPGATLSTLMLMQKSIATLAVAGGLLAATSIFFLLEGKQPAAAAPGDPVPGDEQVADGLAPAQLEGAQRPGQSSESERQVAAPDRISELSAEDLAADADAAALIGRVVDPNGRGVGQAHIYVRRAGGSWFSQETLASASGFHAAENERELESESDGSFRIEPLGSGDYALHVESSGFAPYERALTQDEHVGDLGALGLDAGVLLSGRVVDPQGSSVPDVQILRPDSQLGAGLRVVGERPRGELVAVSDAFGEFHVDVQAVGPWRLIAVHPRFPDTSVEGQTEHPGQHQDEIEITLQPGAAIQGRLVGLPFDLEEPLYVRAAPADAGDLNALSALNTRDSGTSEVRMCAVEQGGQFSVEGLRPDQHYQLRAWSRAPRSAWIGAGDRSRSRVLVVEAGASDVQLPWSRGASLNFQVVDDSTGEPLERFAYQVGSADLMGGWSSSPGVVRQPEGRVQIENVRPRDENAMARIHVTAPGYRPLNLTGVAFRADEENDLGVLRIEPSERLHVTVLEREFREPVRGARVRISELAEPSPSGTRQLRIRAGSASDEDGFTQLSSSGSETARSDADGMALLSSMPGKTVTLSVRADDYAPLEVVLDLPAGQDYEYEVLLVPGVEVIVSVVDQDSQPLEGLRVVHQESQASEGLPLMFGGPPAGTPSDSEGRVVFRDLAPGLHHFRLDERNERGTPSMGMQISLPGMGGDEELEWSEVEALAGGEPASLTLVAAPRGSLSGLATEAGTPLSGAQLSLSTPAQRASPMFLGGSVSATTDSQGRFSLADLVVGDYTLTLNHRSRAMSHELELTIDPGANEVELALDVTVVRGQVLDSEGEPVVGSTVSAGLDDASDGAAGGARVGFVMMRSTAGSSQTIVGGNAGDMATATTDEQGRYELRGLRPEALVRVRVRGPDHSPRTSESFELARREVRQLDIEVLPAGSVRVEVLRADGSPAGSGIVSANYLDSTEESVDPQTSLLTGGGATNLSGLRPGRWEVRLQVFDPANPGPPQSPLEPRVVEVVGGEQAQVNFELP